MGNHFLQVNIGFELGMFDNRLTLDVDYYRDYSKDLIASKNVSSVTGFLNKFVNIGCEKPGSRCVRIGVYYPEKAIFVVVVRQSGVCKK